MTKIKDTIKWLSEKDQDLLILGIIFTEDDLKKELEDIYKCEFSSETIRYVMQEASDYIANGQNLSMDLIEDILNSNNIKELNGDEDDI